MRLCLFESTDSNNDVIPQCHQQWLRADIVEARLYHAHHSSPIRGISIFIAISRS